MFPRPRSRTPQVAKNGGDAFVCATGTTSFDAGVRSHMERTHDDGELTFAGGERSAGLMTDAADVYAWRTMGYVCDDGVVVDVIVIGDKDLLT